ncbi:iron-sulfur protein (4Fe-4S) [Natronomonas pharaonis DSM 2160]|uniref:Iron-sulfur protein (4Fe-4S) n=1 Tax=Natronomonas pharaonis (strain ATCC 35678 / DSM 2160 / CIP 103997 / JCM 8858 / NBRC 14720 / NCIMB 2260 / Gabara) TaxID=348780 RepID=A0A1U7EUX8_NATPD|nr:(Fe-S)-binding protein [Natronomonas pharaonis]CAI48791.1 iron-sulfur protein (4Fe-4S) [Natronomonas pharaonis DSM 2160]
MLPAFPLQANEEVTRQTFWLISNYEKVLFYFLATLTVAVFVYGTYQRFARYADGEDDWFDRLDNLSGRIASAAKIAASNEKQFNRDLVGGLMHAFILWGFLTLLIATTILFIDEWYRVFTIALGERQSFWVGDFYLSYQLVTDALGLLFVVGLGIALWRRYVVRTERLWGKHTNWEDAFLVWSLFLIGIGGFLLEGLRIVGASEPITAVEPVSFVGTATALGLAGIGVNESIAAAVYPVAWWSHALLSFLFIAAIPYAKPFHMLSSFANVVTRDEKAGARLPGVPSDLDATNAESIDDFSWKEMLDQDACTKCGRCSSVCPAKASGRPLDPRDVILDLKEYRRSLETDDDAETMDIVADGGESVIDAETMESCMSCMACMDACPVEIEHLKSFTRMNRQLADQGDIQPSMQEVFQNVMTKGNTFGDSPGARGDWTEELDFEVTDARDTDVEYLWYVGDYPSYDDRNKKVARSLAKIFEHADAEVGILYDEEVYDGNDIRRVGEEFLYVEQAGTLIDSFEDCAFEKIVCTDPHSYNTFKNEYPEVDFEEFADDPMMEFDIEGYWNESGDIEVQHWTQTVEELVETGAVALDGTELDYTVTYHDPCHLGRYNDEYEAPRELVRATGCDLHEMPRNRDNSFCCGGGGGGLWMELEEEEKPSEERLREALEDTEAGSAVEKFVVACPMCMTMYEDGRKTGGFEDDIEIVDIAELIVEALDAKNATITASADADAGTGAAPADD